MTEHVCEWRIATAINDVMIVGTEAVCINEDCHGGALDREEIERRLNEYETLKKATEALRVDVALYIAKMLDPRLVGSIVPLIAYATTLEGK